MMKIFRIRNVGMLDRLLRALPILLTLYLWWSGQLQDSVLALFAIVSAMLLVTSILGSCSIYYMLGWSTCPIRDGQNGFSGARKD
jgi:hypothetical protein